MSFWYFGRDSDERRSLAAISNHLPALLLFILGLILVGLEIFVLPGFGACGIFGILCMLAGLGLVTLDRIPETGAEWGNLGLKVSQYLFALMGALAHRVWCGNEPRWGLALVWKRPATNPKRQRGKRRNLARASGWCGVCPLSLSMLFLRRL